MLDRDSQASIESQRHQGEGFGSATGQADPIMISMQENVVVLIRQQENPT
jgi:hypothetical protein